MSGTRFAPGTIDTNSQSPDKVADIVSHLSINGNPPSNQQSHIDTAPVTPASSLHVTTNNSTASNGTFPVPQRIRQKSFREQIDQSDIPDSPRSQEQPHTSSDTDSPHHHDLDRPASTSSSSGSDITGSEDVDSVCPMSADMQAKIDALSTQIDQFRKSVQHRYTDKSAINPATSEYVHSALHDNEFVYRYLMARSKDVQKALAMFDEAVHYRYDHHIDQILDYECPDGEKMHKLAQQFIHSTDKHGRPVIYEQVGSQDVKSLYAGEGFEERCFYHQYYMEYLIKHHMRRVSSTEHQRVTQVVIVIDMKGLAMSQASKTNYSFVKYVAKVNSLLYPEYMACTYVINSPRIMSFMWNIVKGWLDEKTRTKISIIHGTGLKEAEKLIDKDHYPKQFGGTCQCEGCRAGVMQKSPESQAFLEFVRSKKGHVDPKHENLSADVLNRVHTGQ